MQTTPRLRLALCAAILFCVAVTDARTELRIIATDPPGDKITLGTGQNYSLRIAYETDEPIHIWAAPYFQGSRVDAMTNASDVYTGSGEALGWFALTAPGEVDEVRLSIDHRNSGRVELIRNYPVQITVGTGAVPEPASHAAWVSSLIDQSNELHAEQRKTAANIPESISDRLIAPVFMLIVGLLLLSGFAAPVIAFWKWDGPWRMAAAVPLLLLCGEIVRVLIDLSLDATSHNLWPFEIGMFSLISFGLIAVAALARRVSRGFAHHE